MGPPFTMLHRFVVNFIPEFDNILVEVMFVYILHLQTLAEILLGVMGDGEIPEVLMTIETYVLFHVDITHSELDGHAV